jgi:hypothetical protein|nr:MAG TPA: hypothetical protein [Caudoviricetes sp.]
MPGDPIDIAHQQHAAHEGAALRRQVRQRELESLRALLGLPQGRAFVRLLLERTGVFRSSYAAGDALAMAFQEGARNVGLQVIADLNEADAQAFAHLLMETTDGKHRNN